LCAQTGQKSKRSGASPAAAGNGGGEDERGAASPLVMQGLRNRQIADRLFVSAKTVDHHVGAILRKLGVHTRGEASAAARRLGLAPEDD
jgi:hypothetical protein